jgi:SAM-dependent methyltransferase
MKPRDRPVAWTARYVRDAGLLGDELYAATSNSVGLPQLLTNALDRLPDDVSGPILDLGAGLGGVSAWCKERTGRPTIAFDRSWVSCLGARHLFPHVPAVVASIDAIPLRSGVAALTVVNGVVSLVGDLEGVVAEAARVTAPGGVVSVADLVANGPDDVLIGQNRFPAVEHVVAGLETTGLVVEDIAVGHGHVGMFGPVRDRVVRAVAWRHRSSSALGPWIDDRRLIADLVDRDQILAGGVVARVPRGSFAG